MKIFTYPHLSSLNGKKMFESAAHGHCWGLLIARNGEQAKRVRTDG
jgi:hypothetical protein